MDLIKLMSIVSDEVDRIRIMNYVIIYLNLRLKAEIRKTQESLKVLEINTRKICEGLSFYTNKYPNLRPLLEEALFNL